MPVRDPDYCRDYHGVIHVVVYRLGHAISFACGEGFWRAGPFRDEGFEKTYEAPTCLKCVCTSQP